MYKSPVVIFETKNTDKGHDQLFSKFAVCYNDSDKKKVLKHFVQPTCTKDAELVSTAIKYDSMFER